MSKWDDEDFNIEYDIALTAAFEAEWDAKLPSIRKELASEYDSEKLKQSRELVILSMREIALQWFKSGATFGADFMSGEE